MDEGSSEGESGVTYCAQSAARESIGKHSRCSVD